MNVCATQCSRGKKASGERGAVLAIALIFLTVTLTAALYLVGLAREMIDSAGLLP